MLDTVYSLVYCTKITITIAKTAQYRGNLRQLVRQVSDAVLSSERRWNIGHKMLCHECWAVNQDREQRPALPTQDVILLATSLDLFQDSEVNTGNFTDDPALDATHTGCHCRISIIHTILQQIYCRCQPFKFAPQNPRNMLRYKLDYYYYYWPSVNMIYKKLLLLSWLCTSLVLFHQVVQTH